MKNHVIILLFLSCGPILNVYAAEASWPGLNHLKITHQTIFYHRDWHDLEVELSNGDTITYTILTQGPLCKAHACIYAEKVDEVHEKRYNANADWVSFMHDLYTDMIRSKKNKNYYAINLN